MMLLNTTTRSIEVVLGGAVTTTEASILASYVDVDTTDFSLSTADSNTAVTAGVTPVTAVAAPGASTSRQVKYMSIYNNDTVNIDVTVRYNDNATIYKIITHNLAPGKQLEYVDGAGWRVELSVDQTSINDNTDVTLSAPADGEILQISSGVWINRTLAEAGVSAVGHTHPTSDIVSGTFVDARIAQSNVTQHEAAINHDALTNFVADEHIAHSSVVLTAGVGLSGGGDISASRSFAVDLNELPTEISIAGGDFIPMVDITDSGSGKITLANLEATLNHDSLAGFVADEHVPHSSVVLTAGVGLSGGGDISASRSFAVDLNELPTEVTIADADFISMVDVTDSGSGKITWGNLQAAITISQSQISDLSHAVDFVSNVATNTILGRVTAGSGNSEELTPAQVRTLINVEDGATADQTAAEIEAIVNHDNLLGFVANEHIDWTNATQNLDTSGTGDFGNQVLIEGAAPVLKLYENPGGQVGAEVKWINHDNGRLSFQTRSAAGALVSEDYFINSDAGGASLHRWNVGNFNYMRLESDGLFIGPANIPADGMLHAQLASAGAVTAHVNAREGVFESNVHGGISILTPATQTGNIYFGDLDNDVGKISYNHVNDRMSFTRGTVEVLTLFNNTVIHVGDNTAGNNCIITRRTDTGTLQISGGDETNIGGLFMWGHGHLNQGDYEFRAEDGTRAYLFDSSEGLHNFHFWNARLDGFFGFGVDPQTYIHVVKNGLASGATFQPTAESIVLDFNESNGMSILSPNTTQGNIFFGDPQDNDVGRIIYDHLVDDLLFYAAGALQVRVDSSLGEINIQGNDLVTTGLVDGRDVSVDGTKLDGIESGATADQTGAEIKSAFEGQLTLAHGDILYVNSSGAIVNLGPGTSGHVLKTNGAAANPAWVDPNTLSIDHPSPVGLILALGG